FSLFTDRFIVASVLRETLLLGRPLFGISSGAGTISRLNATAGARGKIDRVCEVAGLLRWPVNGCRHSFASYRLEAIGYAPRVAHELGHTSPQMLYSTYREVVTPEEAERYWKIAPAAEAKNVVAFGNA